MLETLYAQLRFAASVVFGLPFSQRSLDRLIEALLETRREFGSLGSEANELLGGPPLDEEMRQTVQLRRFRTQAISPPNGFGRSAVTFVENGSL